MANVLRLDRALTAAGIPIYGVSDTTPITIHFRDEATPQQRAQAIALRDGFDWSQEAEARYALDQTVAAAIDALDNDTTPVWKAIRSLTAIVADLAADQPGSGKPSRALVRNALKLEIEGDQALPDVRR